MLFAFSSVTALISIALHGTFKRYSSGVEEHYQPDTDPLFGAAPQR
jgi:hypothetical protein